MTYHKLRVPLVLLSCDLEGRKTAGEGWKNDEPSATAEKLAESSKEEAHGVAPTGPSAYELERLEKIRRNAEVTMTGCIVCLALVKAPCRATSERQLGETRETLTSASKIPSLKK